MKLSRRTKYVLAAPLFVVASLALQFTHTIPTYAATLAWTGDGDGTSFSDGDNWNTDAAPQNGDVLTFNVAGLTAQRVLNNDINNLSVAGVTFGGTLSDYYSYTIQGNDLTVTGAINNTSTGPNSNFAFPTIQNNLVLGASIVVTKVHIGTEGATLNLQSNGLTFAGGSENTCGVNLNSNLSGSGNLSVTGKGVNVRGTNTTYSGPIAITGESVFAPAAFGTTAGATTVSGDGSLRVVHTSDISLAEPLTLGGTGYFGGTQGFYGCSGGDGPASKLTLTGGVTLTSNFKYSGVNNTVINQPYTPNGHTFTVTGGTTGTLTTPEGEQVPPEETIVFDGTETGTAMIGNKQTGILNGTRDAVAVLTGGILKGNGTAGFIYVQDGARVNPGNSPGKLTALNEFSISGTYDAEILNAENYDQIAVGENYNNGGSAVAIYSNAILNPILYDGWAINQGDSFTIIDNLSNTPVQGTFDGLDEGAQLVVDGITFSITYVGGDGNDVVLTALNTGTDPDAPNTGVARFVQANPAVVAGFGILAAGLLIALAVRRRNTQ